MKLLVILSLVLMPLFAQAKALFGEVNGCQTELELLASQFPEQSRWQRIHGYWQSEGQARDSFEPIDIQDWLRRYHGLKVALLNLQGRLRFEVRKVLSRLRDSARATDPAHRGFLALSQALQKSNQADQIALFLELSDQVTLDPGDRLNRPVTVHAFDKLLMSAERAQLKNIGILPAFHEMTQELQQRGEATFESIRPAIFTQVMEDWKSGRIRLTPEGTTIAYDDGLPDRYTYVLAKKLQKSSYFAEYRIFATPEERMVFDKLNHAQQLTLKLAMEDPHYLQMQTFMYAESRMGQFNNPKPIWDFIKPDSSMGGPRYSENSIWWTESDHFYDIGPNGEKIYSHITAETSLSPVGRGHGMIYGPDVERVSYYAIEKIGNFDKDENGMHDPMQDVLDLTRMIILVNRNKITKEIYSVEVNANEAVGEPPVGFFLEMMAGDPVPARTFAGKSIKNSEACIRCHFKLVSNPDDPDGPKIKVSSFTPAVFVSPEVVRKVGIRGDPLVNRLVHTPGN